MHDLHEELARQNRRIRLLGSLLAVLAMTGAILVLIQYGGDAGWSGWFIAGLGIAAIVSGGIALHESGRGQRAQVQHLEFLAFHDTLTGLYNLRYFLRQFEHELRRSRRTGEPLSLLLIDVDHFKAYNDRYGHAAGDEALKAVARGIEECARREVDITARYGGEEFCLLLPDTPAAGALQVARRVCATLRGLDLPHERAAAGRLTVSIGVTTHDETSAGVEAPLLMEEADAALYHVKENGRDGARHYRDAVNAPAAA